MNKTGRSRFVNSSYWEYFIIELVTVMGVFILDKMIDYYIWCKMIVSVALNRSNYSYLKPPSNFKIWAVLLFKNVIITDQKQNKKKTINVVKSI